MLVIGALGPTGPCAPERGGKNRYRQEKKNTRYLQTHNAAYAAERTQKTAHAARHALNRLSDRATAHTDTARCLNGRRNSTVLSADGDALACHTSGHPQSNAHDAPDLLRFHSIMMVAVAVAEPIFSAYLRFTVDPGRQRKYGRAIPCFIGAGFFRSGCGPWRYP